MALISILIAALVAPGVAADGSLEPFGFTDAPYDVSVGRDVHEGPGNGTNDVLGGGVEESDGGLHFWLELRDLDGLEAEAEEDGFHAQYALSFITRDDHAGFSMRATFRGEAYTPLSVLEPLHWRFQVHDEQADTWTDVEAQVIEDTIHWYAQPARFGLADGDAMSQWSVQTWNSYDRRDQTSDWASGVGGYRIAEGAFVHEDLDQIPDELEAGVVIGDPGGDVTSRGDPYTGAGAANTDVLWASVAETDSLLVARLALAGLADIQDHDDEERYHVQYALSFSHSEDTYAFRATYRGVGMGGAGPGWTFQLHDQTADEWPSIGGRIEGDHIVWALAKDRIGTADGDVLGTFQVSTWASFEVRDQYGDRASGGSFTIGAGPTYDGTFASDETTAATLEQDIPHGGLVALAAGLLALASRRQDG